MLRLRRLALLLEQRCRHGTAYNDPEMLARSMSTVAGPSTFRYEDLQKDCVPFQEPDYALEDLVFGRTFTDHLLIVEHQDGSGWGRPHIRPFAQGITVHPAAQVLHYGMCCFEGMKAYHGVDGRGRLFRPEMNMARLQRSVRRLMLADYDPGELLACLKELLRTDRGWLPAREGYSLYVRPFAFSSAHTLGVARPTRSTLAIMLSPVGPYFATGLTPVRLFLDERNVRAWPGGVGDHKMGGNYAPTILPQAAAMRDQGTPQKYIPTYWEFQKVGGNYAPTILPQAAAMRDQGTPQVLYTLPVGDGEDPESALISESGAMNVFFLWDKADGSGQQLVTPPLDGTILPGVTRDSILALARAWGEAEVLEANITIRDLTQAAREGRLREMFGCGTACIVQPVDGLVRSNGQVIAAPWDAADPHSLTARLTRALTDIQYGRVASDWSVPFEDACAEERPPQVLMGGDA